MSFISLSCKMKKKKKNSWKVIRPPLFLPENCVPVLHSAYLKTTEAQIVTVPNRWLVQPSFLTTKS